MSIYIGKTNKEADLVSGASGVAKGTVPLRKGFVSTTQPTNPINGDMWIESNTLPATFPVTAVKTYRNGTWSGSDNYSPEMYDIWIYYSTSEGYVSYYRDIFSNSWKQLGINYHELNNYLKLAGGTMTGTIQAQAINPKANNTYDLGTSSAKWKTVYATTFNGNATSADKLKTVRNINGVPFDGTEDIEIDGRHIIINQTGSEMTSRPKLKFLGSKVTDDSANDMTIVEPDTDDLWEQVNTNTGNILDNMKKIQTNEESIGTNKNDITSLKSKMTSAETNIKNVQSSITELNAQVSGINSDLNDVTDRVSTNETDIASLKTKTNTTNQNVTNLQKQVTTNSTNIKSNSDAISALEGRLDTTDSNVANNTEKIDEILKGTATTPSADHAAKADNADKLGGQLPAYYAKASDLNKYLPLAGGTATGRINITGTAETSGLRTMGIIGITSNGSAEGPLYLNYGNSQNVYINTDKLVYHSGNIPKASTSVQGIVQLNNTYTSTSTTVAPTANALKTAYDTVNNALTTHKNDTKVHLTDADRTILTKANKFKGYYETETALKTAHSTGEAGDYAIVNATDTVWIWDEDKEGGAGWKDAAGKGSVISVNNMTGEVVLTKSNLGLGNVDNTSDLNKPVSTATKTELNKKLNLAGGTMTGTINGQNILPKTTTTYTLGDSTHVWKDIYATTFHGALTGNVTGTVSGNAGSATKLQTSRNLTIQDADASHSGTAVGFDGSANINLKLPSTIKATLNGTADKANLLAKNATFNSTAQAALQYYDADFSSQTTTYQSNDWNAPEKAWYQILHMPLSVSNYFNEIAIPVNSVSGIWWRQRRTTNYYGWYKLLDSNNYTGYTVKKDGTGATGTWAIDISKNAATATKLKTAVTINGVEFDGSKNITISSSDSTKLPLAGGTMTGAINSQIVAPKTNNTYTLGTSSMKWSNVYATTFTGALSGNASSATKLATKRSINVSDSASTPHTGTAASFDGSGDVTIKLPSTIAAAIVGNVTGNCSGSSGSCTGNAATATKATQDGNGAVIASTYLKLAGGTMTGTITAQAIASKTNNTYDIGASSNKFKTVYATTFNGALTGNVTGNCSGSSGSCTGNAATATKLATSRSIKLTGDVTGSASFNGSADASIATTVKAVKTQATSLTCELPTNLT